MELWNQFGVWLIFGGCVVLGPINFILYKVMYTSFGSNEAFFVSQAVNIWYVVIGGFALAIVRAKGEITEDMLKTPHLKFVIMGMLDCCSGFLAAMGSSQTPGGVQQLLNQTMIPCTMFASWLFLGTSSKPLQIIGAIIIFIGAIFVVLPSIIQSHNTPQHIHLLSYGIFFSSNIPFAASYVYKELGFKNHFIHVIYLTQWVSIYQFILGFILAPLQQLPGFGTATGMSWQDMGSSFVGGWKCFTQQTPMCQDNHAFSLLLGYTIVNFAFNTLGLYLVKHGSATFNAISYAVILPVTTLAFTLPILGSFQENFQVSTVLGLVVVLFGFYLWKYESLSGHGKTAGAQRSELVYGAADQCPHNCSYASVSVSNSDTDNDNYHDNGNGNDSASADCDAYQGDVRCIGIELVHATDTDNSIIRKSISFHERSILPGLLDDITD